MENAKEEERSVYVRLLQLTLRRLPSRFSRVLEMMVNFSTRNSHDRWDWVTWEDHPSEQVFTPVNSRYCDRIFALLFARSNPSHEDQLEAIKGQFPRARLYKIEKNDSQIRHLLDSIKSRPEGELLKEDWQKPNWLDTAFNVVAKTATLNEQRAIVEQPISQDKCKIAKDSFGEAYRKESTLKNVISTEIIWDEDFDEGFFGINLLIERDYFTGNESRMLDELMRHYGSDAGKQESLLIFNKICETAILSNQGIDSAIQQLIQNGVNRSDIVLITNGYHRTIRNSGRLKFIGSDNKQAEYTDSSGNSIPVYLVLGRAIEPKSILVMAKSAAAVRSYLKTSDQVSIVEQTQFVFRLVDPKENKEIRRKILSDDPSWLLGETTVEKEAFAALRLWLRILECFDVEVLEPTNVLKVNFGLGSSTDETDD